MFAAQGGHFLPSTYTVLRDSHRAGRLMPMLASLLSPGPLTIQPSPPLSFLRRRCTACATRHLRTQIGLDALRQFLEHGAGGASAAGAGCNHGARSAAPCLQDFLRHHHFLRAVAAWFGVSETRMVSPILPGAVRPARQWKRRCPWNHACLGQTKV